MLICALLQAAVISTAQAPTRFELPNGLRVWVYEDHTRPVALVQVTYKAGSINEESGKTGIAHYVEHMVYRATQHIRNEDVYGYIDRIGGRYTGGTWPEFTQYAETVPSWALESALRVTAERMCCALFDSTEFERERSNVVTEANGFSDTDPLSALKDAVMYTSFEAHPYRLNSNTWARDNLVLARDDAFAWYKRYYGPNNAVLVIVGDVTTSDVRRLVETHFSAIPRAPGSGRVAIVEPPQRVAKRVSLTDPSATPYLDVVYHAPNAAHPDYPTLDVVRQVLGLRLGRALGADTAQGELSVSDSASEYPHVLRFSIPTPDPDRILALIDAQIDSLGRYGAPAVEIATAMGFRVLQAPLDLEGQEGAVPPRRSRLTHIADSLAALETQPWEVTQRLRADIERAKSRVTSDDIKRIVHRWLRDSQRTVGILRRGPSDFVAQWSDGRALAGERMEIPPLTTAPAKRLRPDPVPAAALAPLAPLAIRTGRRVLANGIVLTVASVPGAGDSIAVHLRADSGVLSTRGGHVDMRRITRVSSVDPALNALAGGARRFDLPGQLSVAVVASGDTAKLLDLAARAFATVPRRRSAATTPSAAGTRKRADSTTSRQTQVSIVARLPGVPRDHPDRRALELLNYIVGVPSYGGRLGWALTKSGLTYAAAARTTFADATGEIALSTTADTRNVPAAIQAIREVIAGVAADGVDEWELREAQAFTLGRAILYGARDDSSPAEIATALLDSESARVNLLDLPAFSRTYLAVTLDEINRVARVYYRPERLSVSATGAVPGADARSVFPDGTFRKIFEP